MRVSEVQQGLNLPNTLARILISKNQHVDISTITVTLMHPILAFPAILVTYLNYSVTFRKVTLTRAGCYFLASSNQFLFV